MGFTRMCLLALLGASSTLAQENPEQDAPPTPYTLECPPNTLHVTERDATITLADCEGPTTLQWDCPPTETVEIAENPSVDFALGCTRWTGTADTLPTHTTWPEGALEWVDDEVDDEGDGDKSTCRLWFFFVSALPTLSPLRG